YLIVIKRGAFEAPRRPMDHICEWALTFGKPYKTTDAIVRIACNQKLVAQTNDKARIAKGFFQPLTNMAFVAYLLPNLQGPYGRIARLKGSIAGARFQSPQDVLGKLSDNLSVYHRHIAQRRCVGVGKEARSNS